MTGGGLWEQARKVAVVIEIGAGAIPGLAIHRPARQDHEGHRARPVLGRERGLALPFEMPRSVPGVDEVEGDPVRIQPGPASGPGPVLQPDGSAVLKQIPVGQRELQILARRNGRIEAEHAVDGQVAGEVCLEPGHHTGLVFVPVTPAVVHRRQPVDVVPHAPHGDPPPTPRAPSCRTPRTVTEPVTAPVMSKCPPLQSSPADRSLPPRWARGSMSGSWMSNGGMRASNRTSTESRSAWWNRSSQTRFGSRQVTFRLLRSSKPSRLSSAFIGRYARWSQ